MTADLFAPPETAAKIAQLRTAAAGKKPRRKRSGTKKPEDEFAFQCMTRKLPTFKRQYRFAKEALGRQWQFDFAFPEYQLAVELEGLVVASATIGGKKRLVSMGRHAHADGFREDCRKYASAAMLGWVVIRFEVKMVGSGEAIDYTIRVLAARGWKPGEG